MTMGHLYIEPKRVSVSPSSWLDQPRDGFTAHMAKALQQPVPVDDVSDQEAQLLIERQHIHSALIGLGRYRSTVGVRAIVSNN